MPPLTAQKIFHILDAPRASAPRSNQRETDLMAISHSRKVYRLRLNITSLLLWLNKERAGAELSGLGSGGWGLGKNHRLPNYGMKRAPKSSPPDSGGVARRAPGWLDSLPACSHSQHFPDRGLFLPASYLSATVLTTRIGSGFDPLTPAPLPQKGEGSVEYLDLLGP